MKDTSQYNTKRFHHCGEKTSFPTEKKALNKSENNNVYKCEHCNSWHVGYKKQEVNGNK